MPAGGSSILSSSRRAGGQIPEHVNEIPDGFAADWFRTHPDVAIDRRSPGEKLEDIKEKLRQDLSDNDRVRLLAQQKTLAILDAGHESLVHFDALVALAEFYNAQSRPESALRHLDEAKRIREQIKPGKDSDFCYWLEFAWAALATRWDPKSEGKGAKLRAQTQKGLRRHEAASGSDRQLYRRDLCLARFDARANAFDDALRAYARAKSHLADNTPDWAEIVEEIAEVHRSSGDLTEALRHWKLSHACYSQLGLTDCAKALEPRIEKAQRQAPAPTRSKPAVVPTSDLDPDHSTASKLTQDQLSVQSVSSGAGD